MPLSNPRLPANSLYFKHGSLMTDELRTRLESLALQYGRTYDSYLVTELNREFFWAALMRESSLLFRKVNTST